MPERLRAEFKIAQIPLKASQEAGYLTSAVLPLLSGGGMMSPFACFYMEAPQLSCSMEAGEVTNTKSTQRRWLSRARGQHA